MSEKKAISIYDSCPESLYNICLHYIVVKAKAHNILNAASRFRKCKGDVVIPAEICEDIIKIYQKKYRVDDDVVNLFRSRNSTSIKIIKLRNSRVSDRGLNILMKHKPWQVELVQCEHLTATAIDVINCNSHNLVSLKFGPNTHVFPQDEDEFKSRGYILDTPNLKRLTINCCSTAISAVLLIKPLSNLTHLDLSECNSIVCVWALDGLKNLVSLILHSVPWLINVLDWITSCKNLRHLDVSQANEKNGQYFNPNNVLAKIVTSLPHLECLDISGTNLAGSGSAAVIPVMENPSGDIEMQAPCDIPGLLSRVNKPLEFLGLYSTHYGACKRHDIPAKVISGDANEEQILAAAVAYMERPAVLTRVLNDLYYWFRYENSAYVAQALPVVLDAMGKHVNEKHIQISGSATLFYIVKGKEKGRIGVNLKRRIITALLDAMETHFEDDTMMRNGCLTLCQFKIPADVLFEYERVVKILLSGVSDVNQENFVQRIAIYLLNSLACQVDDRQKRFLGEHGAIHIMLNLIGDRIDRRISDDVMEVAWSTMWNVTDETPQNCQRFLDYKGMEHFLCCLKTFPEKEELLRNMMGLLGNVAEVAELRPRLMNRLFLSVFNELLDSNCDGIEVSYNAAGVLAHMASDGQDAWTVEVPNRFEVLDRLAAAVDRWELRAERNINYRSFQPILGLLRVFHTPQCQHWATWALANLTSVYPEKYCTLVENENGIRLLQDLLISPSPYMTIKQLATVVITNCSSYANTGRVPPPDVDI